MSLVNPSRRLLPLRIPSDIVTAVHLYRLFADFCSQSHTNQLWSFGGTRQLGWLP